MSTKIKQDISIGNNLKLLRATSKLSQEQVTARLQTMGIPISREILSQMESSRYSIRVSVLLALKEIYNAEYADFFNGLSISSLDK